MMLIDLETLCIAVSVLFIIGFLIGAIIDRNKPLDVSIPRNGFQCDEKKEEDKE